MPESRRDEPGLEPRTSAIQRYSNQPFANGLVLPPIHPGWHPEPRPIQERFAQVAQRGNFQSVLLPGESAGITPPKSNSGARDQDFTPFAKGRSARDPSPDAKSFVSNSPSAPTAFCGATTSIGPALLDRSKSAEAFCDPKTSRITQILDVEYLVRKTLARDFPREDVNPYYGGGVSGTGNVHGPSVSTDNAVARFDGTTGTRIQDSGLIVDDVAPVTGYVVHTPNPAGTLAEALVVRPGNPSGGVTCPGAKLTLQGGDAGPVAGPFAGGDVEISGGAEPSGGPSGNVLIGPLSLDLNSPRLAAQGDSNTGISFLGGDVLALVTNGAYALAVDQDRVVETTSGRRLALFRTSGNATLTSANDIVIVTGNHTITLEATPLGGQRHIIRNGHSAAINVSANGNDFNGSGALGLTLAPGSGAEIEWDSSGNTWWITLATAPNGGLGDPGANGLVVRTALGVTTARSIAVSSKLSIADADGVSGNPTLDVTEANLTLNNIGGTLGATKGGTGITSYAQGDLIACSIANTLGVLAKDTNATRYLSNKGKSNQAAWSQVTLSDGVTGTLPIANGGTGGTTAALARMNILPALAGNALKGLRVNAGETDAEWATITAAMDIAGLTAQTAALSPSSDYIPIYIAAVGGNRKVAPNYLFSAIDTLSQLTAPAADDNLLITDTSDSDPEARYITTSDLFKAVGALTQKTSVTDGYKFAVVDESGNSGYATFEDLDPTGLHLISRTVAYSGTGSSGLQVTLTGINRAYILLWFRDDATTNEPEIAYPIGATGTTRFRRTGAGSQATTISLDAPSAGTSQIVTINNTGGGMNVSSGNYRILVIGTST